MRRWNLKKIFISLVLIVIGFVFGLGVSVLAWVNPSQSPPSGGGVVQTDNSGLKIATTTQITSGNLIVNNGNVGIGTTTPAEKLAVVGNIDVAGNRILNLASPINSTDAATKGYVDAQSGGGVCYTNYGGTTCASGFTAVLTGYTTIYYGGEWSDRGYGFTGGLACSSITHDVYHDPYVYDAYGTSKDSYATALNNEPCVICCK